MELNIQELLIQQNKNKNKNHIPDEELWVLMNSDTDPPPDTTPPSSVSYRDNKSRRIHFSNEAANEN